MGVCCPCPPVRNVIVTPRHLFTIFMITQAKRIPPHIPHISDHTRGRPPPLIWEWKTKQRWLMSRCWRFIALTQNFPRTDRQIFRHLSKHLSHGVILGQVPQVQSVLQVNGSDWRKRRTLWTEITANKRKKKTSFTD